MDIKRIYDKELIKKVHTHPQIWKEISRGCGDINKYKLKLNTTTYYRGAYIDNNLIGLGNASKARNGKYYCHLQVLPEYRQKYALGMTKEFIKYFWDNTKVNSIYLLIHPELRHILIYAIKLGFKKISLDLHTLSVFNTDNTSKRWLLELNRGELRV